jgi:hypothetical protein
MIEFTTGVVLLVSSLYVAGNPQKDAMVVNTADFGSVNIATSTNSVDMTSKAVEKYIREQFKDEPILIEIARCESTFRQFDKDGHIIRGKVNSGDVGVMQINEKYHADTSNDLGMNIYTLEGNVRYGRYLYEKFGAQPWKSSSKCWGGTVAAESIAMK